MSRTSKSKAETRIAARILDDKDLDAVSGGLLLTSAFSNVIKAIGDSLSSVARKA